jgi:hypothetical protein
VPFIAESPGNPALTIKCMSGHVLPTWAAWWPRRLRTDASPQFWRRVGRLAEEMGCPKKEDA